MIKGISCPIYWMQVKEKWLKYARLCRYGHQNLSSILGRTPTEWELTLLDKGIQYYLNIEFAPKENVNYEMEE